MATVLSPAVTEGVHEDDLLPISALQHLVFCERQCALIHIERAWRENRLTLEGAHLHARVDEGAPRHEARGDVIVVRGLPLRSFGLGLAGRADVVEFRRCHGDSVDARSGEGFLPGVRLPGRSGLWAPFPVDYKRGRPKPDVADEVQLCAQGLCIEEMLRASVPRAALFYGRLRHRHEVALDGELRRRTVEVAERLHVLVRSGITPRAIKEPKCRRCSLLEICRPEAMSRGRSARRYLAESMKAALREETSAP